ncbi:hypothetical protein F8M41_004093 [Gigaspora margarita]|uniref:Uncharacterized protein n=1 Tax=Gigaspora margarita TaxID=4874 RepID=A0A8H3XC73_GIGMA|nr:hypothetical protein F8M41_004093 [Gigaspora margarita]
MKLVNFKLEIQEKDFKIYSNEYFFLFITTEEKYQILKLEENKIEDLELIEIGIDKNEDLELSEIEGNKNEDLELIEIEIDKNEDLELSEIEIIDSKITKGALLKKLESISNVTYSLYKDEQQVAMFYYFITIVDSGNETYIRYMNFKENKFTKNGAVDDNHNISLKKELISEYYKKSNKITESEEPEIITKFINSIARREAEDSHFQVTSNFSVRPRDQ